MPLRAAQPRSLPTRTAERLLARVSGWVVPVAGSLAAIVAAWVGGPAPAFLVLAATALLGTVALLWASLRTLSGEAPLPERVRTLGLGPFAPASERKREVLRALKDLELERSIGKIDHADYLELVTRYRAVAKEILRELDTGVEPRREQAEHLVKEYLERSHLGAPEKTHDAS